MSRAYYSQSDALRSIAAKIQDAKPPINVLLLGKTGSGKSSLGNAILNILGATSDQFQVASGFLACQVHKPVAIKATHKGREFCIVDTPGVKDNTTQKQEAVKAICKAVSCCPNGVHAFLLLIRLDMRFTDEEQAAVEQLHQLFGDTFWNFAIGVFSHGDSLDNDTARFQSTLDEGKRMMPQFATLLSRLGSRVIMVSSSSSSAQLGNSKICELVALIDSVTNANGEQTYTNELFQAAQLALEKNKNTQLEQELRSVKEEVKQLKANHTSALSTSKKVDELIKKIESLEQKIQKGKDEMASEVEKEAKKSKSPCHLL